MRVGIIGAGKLGCSLAQGLNKKGFIISGIYSKSTESANFLNGRINTLHENDLKAAVKNSELIFITVPDAALELLSYEIEKKADEIDIRGKTFLHCSGALTSTVLDPIKAKGGKIGTLHPIQTFADRNDGFMGLEGIYFGFEGTLEAKKLADTVVKAFNGSTIRIEKEYKPLYHAAACILSNYLVALTYLAGNLFNKIGIEAEVGIKAFMPLIEKTVKNIEELGSSNALTGPISRGDCNVLIEHISALKENSPETLEVYSILGKVVLELALKKGSIDNISAEKIYKILSNA